MTKFTYAQTKAAAQAVIERAPRAKNPFTRIKGTDKLRCLYTDVNEPTRHCLGAEILLELGLRIPDEETYVTSGPNEDRFTAAAEDFINYLVTTADNGAANARYAGDHRLEWRTAFNRVTGLEEPGKFNGLLIGEGEEDE